MTEHLRSPLKPCVTPEQAMAYDPKRPETKTESYVVNAVVEAIYVVGSVSSERICRYLEVKEKDLDGALKIAVGIGLFPFRHAFLKYQYLKISMAHPDWSSDMVAMEMGFKYRSTLWRILNHPPRVKK